MQEDEHIWAINDEGGRVCLSLTPELCGLSLAQAQQQLCDIFLAHCGIQYTQYTPLEPGVTVFQSINSLLATG